MELDPSPDMANGATTIDLTPKTTETINIEATHQQPGAWVSQFKTVAAELGTKSV